MGDDVVHKIGLMRLAAVALLLAGWCLPTAAQAQPRLEVSADEKAVLDLVNAERRREGLKPYSANSKLFAAARAHSRNMAAQQKMDHTLDGKPFFERIRETGFQGFGTGENITIRGTAAEAVAAWMASKAGHRESILAPKYAIQEGPNQGQKPAAFDEAGVGVAVATNGQRYWTLVMGFSMAALENPTLVVSGSVVPPDGGNNLPTPDRKDNTPKPVVDNTKGQLGIKLKVEGALTDATPLIQKLNKYHMVYQLPLKGGEKVTIDLKGTFDTFLVINDDTDRPVAFNDDVSPTDRNSRLMFTAPRTATYYVIVSSYGEREKGTYTLTVSGGQ